MDWKAKVVGIWRCKSGVCINHLSQNSSGTGKEIAHAEYNQTCNCSAVFTF